MDIQTALLLNDINRRFYKQQAESFSSTRHGSWAGWDKALEYAEIKRMPRSVVDVACGNQRFEEFLLKKFQGQPLNALCLDNCPSLNELSRAPEESAIRFRECDIVAALFDDNDFLLPSADLVACFGFMHHVPTREARKKLINTLYSALNPGGFLFVSFWQFMSVESIAHQALELTKDCELTLDDDDYLLGWQNSPVARRYCHNFDVEQVRDLSPIDDSILFEADGRNGRLNVYLVVKKPL